MKYLSIIFAIAFLTSHAEAEVASTKFDDMKAHVQEICPVSGKALGSMGDPLKVKIGQEEVFLCCKSCTKGKINPTHWAAIHKNFAAAQGMCPVMEKNLPANPKFTVVDGQIVYICCPPCTKKIQATPQEYLTKVAGYYKTSLNHTSDKNGDAANKNAKSISVEKAISTLKEADQLQAKVQKICPVSGNKLGTMGKPTKVRVGELEVFLCCDGCKQGKINKQHWVSIANNIKKAQSRCPVMEKELPAQAKSVIVNGQLVYVCCPPCTKKITDAPEKYLQKVADFYKASITKPERVAQLPPKPTSLNTTPAVRF